MRRGITLFLVASIVLNAALGIYALLVGGPLGTIELNVLLTSVSISAAGALALACIPALERGLLGSLPRLALGATVVGCGVFIAWIWHDDVPGALERSAFTLLIVAVAGAHVCLVGLASLAHRFRWAVIATALLTLVLAALVASAVWSDWEEDSDAFFRATGVVAVLLAAFTLLVPVLHRVSRGEARPVPAEGAAARFCPRCGAALVEARPGTTTCTACGARFSVRFER
jgi:hypothetical protein